MKKWFAALLAVAVFFAFTPLDADAKRSFKSSRGTFQQTPSSSGKTQVQDNVSKSESATAKSATGTTSSGSTANRGSLSGGGLAGGGGFMKGLMLGGLAGFLFGGLLGSLGAFGELLGLMVNVLAIYLLFVLGRTLYRNYKERQAAERRRY
jgi:hypothetical protein